MWIHVVQTLCLLSRSFSFDGRPCCDWHCAWTDKWESFEKFPLALSPVSLGCFIWRLQRLLMWYSVPTSKFDWSCRQCWNHPVKKLSKALETPEDCSGCKVPGGFAPSFLLRCSHVIKHLIFDENNYERTVVLTNNSEMMSEKTRICQWIVLFTLPRVRDVV